VGEVVLIVIVSVFQMAMRFGFLVLAVGAVGGFEERMEGMLCGFRQEHAFGSLLKEPRYKN
jgi:hypothetical protein